MSTFYLLPPRPQLGQRFAGYLKAFFPGLEWRGPEWGELAELLASAVGDRPDVFVVFGEELPDGEEPGTALTDYFGAEPGDEVVEASPGDAIGEVRVRRWSVGRTAG